MQKVDHIRWPDTAGGDLAVRIALPSPCTLNQTPLVLAPETVAVFLPTGAEPIVLDQETKDLSFEIDGVLSGLAQLFYSKPYEGAVWLVRTNERECPWSVDLDGFRAGGILSLQVTDPVGFVTTWPDEPVSDGKVVAWVRDTWERAFAMSARGTRGEDRWAEAADEAMEAVAPIIASRGLRLAVDDDPEALDPEESAEPERATRPPPAPDEALMEALELVALLTADGSISFADGMVAEQAAVALADRLLQAGCHVDEDGAEEVWEVLEELPGVLVTISWEDFAKRVERVVG